MAGDRIGPNARNSDASGSRGHAHERAARRSEAEDLYGFVRRLLTDARLYDPQELAPRLRLTPAGGSVVIDWLPVAPLPPTGTRHALRIALLEVLTSAGLNAVYEPPPCASSSGTITVTRPAPRPRASSGPEPGDAFGTTGDDEARGV